MVYFKIVVNIVYSYFCVIFRTKSSTTRLNEVKNLKSVSGCIQILRFAQDDIRVNFIHSL